jgi:hypothetical protein
MDPAYLQGVCNLALGRRSCIRHALQFTPYDMQVGRFGGVACASKKKPRGGRKTNTGLVTAHLRCGVGSARARATLKSVGLFPRCPKPKEEAPC